MKYARNIAQALFANTGPVEIDDPRYLAIARSIYFCDRESLEELVQIHGRTTPTLGLNMSPVVDLMEEGKGEEALDTFVNQSADIALVKTYRQNIPHKTTMARPVPPQWAVKYRPMSAKQFRDLIDRLGYAEYKIAAILGIGSVTLARYRDGEVKVPPAISLAMTALYHGYGYWSPKTKGIVEEKVIFHDEKVETNKDKRQAFFDNMLMEIALKELDETRRLITDEQHSPVQPGSGHQ